MPEKTDLNISPYYDDFSEDKKFQKVLFRAGRPLQSRELTQTQSILQNQVERFGSHMFEEGSLVTGAESDIDMAMNYVKVKSANPNSSGDTSVESYRTSFHNKFIRGKSSGVVAQVFNSSAETSDDSLTLFVKFLQQGTDSANSAIFYQNEDLQECTLGDDGTVTAVSGNNNEFTVLEGTSSPIGRASIASITEGIVFVRGFFCKVDSQTLILEKYSGKPSYRVGLEITETLVSSADDSSLLDNSQGTTNENAAGADRLKMELVLSKYALDSTEDTDFVELARVNNGIIEVKITKPRYSEIENTLARRTFDANGDFVLRQFTHSLREHLDINNNRGFYPADNGGDATKFMFQVSPGKAYVRGYEIDKVGTTNIGIPKARSTQSLANTNTPVRLGNKLRVFNTHSFPEFGNETGPTPHNEIYLLDSTPTAGTVPSSGRIGIARARSVDLQSGTVNSGVFNDTSIFNIYLFDIKMFTKLSGTVSGTFTAGDKLVSSSGATGIIAETVNSGSTVLVYDVVGTFGVNDTITTQGATSGTTTLTAVRNYNLDRARGVAQNATSNSNADFTADIYLDSDKVLAGQLTFTSSDPTVTGFATQFTKELKEGDQLVDGAGNVRIVSSVTNDTELELTANGAASFTGNVVRRRARLFDQDQTASIFAWPRDYVATHSGDFVTVKRQEIVTVTSNAIALETGDNATFGDRSTDNFNIACIYQDSGNTAGTSFSVGDLIDVTTLSGTPANSGSGQTLSLTVPNNNNDAKLLVSYTVQKNTTSLSSQTSRQKTLNQSRLLQVGSARSAGGFYGTAYDDKDISLGVADVFKIHGIYEGVGGADPLPANATFTQVSGSFSVHEIVKGQTSGARARLITAGGSTHYYYYISGTFVDGESLVGEDNAGVYTISNISAGSPNIKNNFTFDDGQRDGYYDLCKLVRKNGVPTPTGKLLILFDYFTSSAGDYFDVESYSSIDYGDIPVYSPNRVDLGGLEPDGTFELSDAVDCRPVVADLIGTSGFESATMSPTSPVNISNNSSGITASPFKYESRDFTSANGAVAQDTPVPGSSIVGDISFYVGRIDKVFLHKDGGFQVSSGIPSLTPTKPAAVDDAIELFELQIPAYTNKLKELRVRSQDHRRFTMKDIGKINNRVTNLERITSLSLLERDTQTKQILDADGFDRFKSGFLVDNFRGHRVGDVNHPDYQISIDSKLGAMRPKSYSQFFDINFESALSSNFQKTGDLITVPYDQVTYVNQDKASRHINVNPYHVFNFFGSVKLTPETDIWQDTEQLPEVRINREGNFDAVLAENANSIGTVWNSWQTTWVGEPNVVSSEVQATSNGSWSGDPAQGGEWVAGLQVTREVTETVETQTRTGVTTSVVEDFVETRSDRVVSVSIIPFMRARTIEVDATNLKPGSNHYFFFDGIRVDQYVRPYNTSYSQDGGVTVSSGLKSDGNGRLRAYFELPNNNTQRFATGARELRITSSYYDLSNPNSQATGTYQAQGLLQSNQTEVVSTRNGRVIMERVTGQRDFVRVGERTNAEQFDTIAPFVPPAEVPIPELPPVDIGFPVDTIPLVSFPISTPIQVPPSLPPLAVPEPVPPVFVPPAPSNIPNLFGQDLRLNERGVRGFMPRGWGDPLAQSFLVDKSGGMFVTSLDVFFQAKDGSLPVSVEIRNMVNGYPGQTVLPFSTVTKNPADVNTSADGSVATNFQFDSPVYLEESHEYCFVVYSNSNNYECWISRMGEKDLATQQTISGQPYAGSLFLSQNASTWTATQEDDLKFHMKIASFDTTKRPVLKFTNASLPVSDLQENPIETFDGQTYVKVYNYFHGMYTNSSQVIIDGVAGDKLNGVLGIGTPSVSETPTDGTYNLSMSGGSGSGVTVKVVVSNSGSDVEATITDPGSGYAQSDSLTYANFDGGTADLTIAVSSVGDTLGGIPVAAINTSFTGSGTNIDNIEMDSFTVTPDLTSYSLDSSYTANDDVLGGGANATCSRNYYYDTLHTMIPNITFADTRISSSVLQTPMNSPEGYSDRTAYSKRTSNEFITLNDNVFFGSPHIIASSTNEGASHLLQSEKSFTATLQLMTMNPNTSPVIDIGTIGAIAIGNRINSISSSSDVPTGTTYVPSTEADGDNNAYIYCTRKVNLKTPASSIKVIADVFRPPTTEVEFMYKTLENDISTSFDDVDWKYFNTDGSPDSSIEADARNFKEYEFTVEDLPEFTAFAVKIVGKGTNTSVVPMVSALRCLGLA